MAWVIRKIDLTLTAITRSNSASSTSSMGRFVWLVPALLITMSRPPRSLDRRADGRAHRLAVGDVAFMCRAGRADRLRHQPRPGAIEIENGDARALRRESLGNAAPEAGRSASDNRPLALEPHHFHPPTFLMPRMTDVLAP